MANSMTPLSSMNAPVLRNYYDDTVVFFGLQYFISDYLMDEWQHKFFGVPKDEAISSFKRRMDRSLGKDAVDTSHFEALYDLGYLPLEIRALPEGTNVPIGVPMFTVNNTHDDFAWLTNYIETVMSAEIWKPCTTATIAREYRKVLMDYARKTGTPESLVDNQAYDFSFQGMSGRHDAAVAGAGHLLSFDGTDTIPAIDMLEEYYNAGSMDGPIGNPVPATENSITSLGTSGDPEKILCGYRVWEDAKEGDDDSIPVLTQLQVHCATLSEKAMARFIRFSVCTKTSTEMSTSVPTRVLATLPDSNISPVEATAKSIRSSVCMKTSGTLSEKVMAKFIRSSVCAKTNEEMSLSVPTQVLMTLSEEATARFIRFSVCTKTSTEMSTSVPTPNRCQSRKSVGSFNSYGTLSEAPRLRPVTRCSTST